MTGLFNLAAAPGSGNVGGLIGLLAGAVGKNAAGTDSWRGGLTWVGERGPEIVNVPRGAQIIPNDVARRAGSAGVSVTLGGTTIDARGSTMTEGELRAILDQRDRRLASAVPTLVRDAQRRGLSR